MSGFVNGLSQAGAMFFFNAFAFLEVEPEYKCQMTKGSDQWTIGTPHTPLSEEYCSGQYVCEIDWDSK